MYTIIKYFLTIAMLSFAILPCQSQKQSEKTILPAEVVEEIEKRISKGITPSMAIAWIDSTGTYFFNFGKTKEDGMEVDENTIYEIGSISKVFTAILLAQQVVDGKLALNDQINDLLPDGIEVPVMGDKEITLGSLSDHTSGLPGMPANFSPANPNNPYADYSLNQLYEAISTYSVTREVGSEYEYSNLGMGLLGHLLAKKQNTSYEELVIQTIAKPLGMDDTRIELSETMKENLALGHLGGQIVDNWDIPTLAGAGAIRSSTADMAKFIAANLAYVNTDLRDAMTLSHQIRHDKAGGMSVAMAWHVKKGEEGDVIWHNGGTGGYKSFAGFVKETGKGVVILTNSTQGSDDIGFHLLDPGFEMAEQNPNPNVVEVADSILSSYVGVYELQPGFNISISKEAKQLFAQATGQDRFEIFPESDTLFFLKAIKAKISFQVNQGDVQSLTLIQRGQEMPGKKIE